MHVFTTVRTIELNRKRRTSEKAQSAAEFMVKGNHLSVERPVHYNDLADLLETDERNLKKVLDAYPGFVRIAGTGLYFYLSEFYDVAQSLDMYYPTELPYSIKRRNDIPDTVASMPVDMVDERAGQFTTYPVITEPMRNVGKEYGEGPRQVHVYVSDLSPWEVKSNQDLIDMLQNLTDEVKSNMTLTDGKLPGTPESRRAALVNLLSLTATLTDMADPK